MTANAMARRQPMASAPRASGAALSLLLAGSAMGALDTSIVNVAVPAIRRGLAASDATAQMVVAAYLLTYAVLLVTGARLGRDHGPTRIYLLGIALFTATSLVCGAAPTAAVLVGARAAQGIGAALMVPQVLTIIQALFTGPARVRAVGLYSLMLGVGVASGQVLGGLLVSADVVGLGWRAVFLVNVPLGAGVLVLGSRGLPRLPGSGKAPIDGAGTVLLAGAVLLLLVPLTFGREQHWPSWTWPCLLMSAALGIAFARTEARIAARGGAPLLHPDLARTPGVFGGLLAILVTFIGFGGLLFGVAVHLQTSLGYSAMRSGLSFVATPIGFGAVNALWRRLPRTWHRWLPVAGVLVAASANALLALSLATGGGRWSLAETLLLGIEGAGHGAAFGAMTAQIVARVDATHAAAASGAITTLVQLGVSIGVAAIDTLYLACAHAADPLRDARALGLAVAVLAVVEAAAIAAGYRLATSPEQARPYSSARSGVTAR